MMKYVFEERQKFRQWWLWLLLLGIWSIPLVGLIQQVYFGLDFGTQPMSNLGLGITFCLMTTFLVFFWIMRLDTKITDGEIQLHFFPLIKKKIPFEKVKDAKVVQYGFVGYGVRLGTKHGTIYNTKGDKGLAIETVQGDRLVIGTQKPEELAEVIKDILSMKN